ncbi:MAG: GatB/YqeY domain-containing protein [Acidaminococcaceae bacterium]|nr:GatB/YqeY domain-containing protein [Acidaminococcaceae bacterium]MBQ7418154.1 GatB/YqeY domain-containing protein [Acidaminococcaceae bacterium]MBQ8491397.1 GatB/YqeY domain-containing protein [Acidaminococcaceae bacterium]MBQ9255717.1 GatB/YqeY domain-containing protein [Acidaminococcaceae bacterium]
MTTKEKLMADMKQAMKDREAGKLRLEVIRMVRSDIRNAEINGKNKEELTENEVLAVIMKAVKMREDSLAEFIKGQRQDLIDQTKAELDILKAYLPAAMSDEELTGIIKEAIASVGAVSPKDMGKVMKAVLPQVQGRADGKRINTIVKSLLQ